MDQSGALTYSRNHQAYCPNPLFYLYPTKSIFRPTFGHWISTFYSSMKSLEQKKADCTIITKNFSTDFCKDAFKEMLNICSSPSIFAVLLQYLQLSFNKNFIFKIFPNIFAYLNLPW